MSTLEPHRRPRRKYPLLASELTARAYEAAAEPSRWPDWFSAFADSVGHRASNLVIRGFGMTRYVCLDNPGSGFETINPSRVFENKALSKRSFALAYVAGELVEEWSQLQTDESAPGGIQVYADESRSLEASDRAVLRAVLPHLHRALVLHFRFERLRHEHDTLTTCLDELCTGMLLLDATGRVLHANRAARHYLDGPYGLVAADGKLEAQSHELGEAFERNLKAATAGRRSDLVGQPLPCGATLWFRGLGPDRAIAYIASDCQRALAPELLADAFELSPAESRVGSLFVLGLTLDEIGAQLGISVHTVRLHVKKLQQKTGTHRQAALLRRMLEAIPKVNP